LSPQVTAATAVTDVIIRLVGESGEGTVSLGDLTVQMLVSMGLDIFTYQTFPAEIKGGTVMYQIRTSSAPLRSHGDYVDVMVALNGEGFEKYGQGLRENGILLYDSDSYTPTPEPGRFDIALPISTFAKAEKEKVKHDVSDEQLKRLPAPKNIVGLGALLTLIGAPLEPAEKYIQDLFARKGEAIVGMNRSALHSGAEHVLEQVGNRKLPTIQSQQRTHPVITVNGNQMLCLGVIAGGLKFYAGYPITPASEIMEYLAKELPSFGGDVIQAEDEIAAIAMAIGASYAGKRSMTASSGPGISLMVEQINLAGQAEIPLVIADVQRGGASTGLPTKTSQGDLNLALYGVHNESPRAVLTPTDTADCFWAAIDALNIAEEYQMPVMLLSDQALATHKASIAAPDMSGVVIRERVTPTEADLNADDGYARFKDTESGISPMSTPGLVGGAYVSTGIEHDEYGDPGYTPKLAVEAKNKRFRKFDTLLKNFAGETAHYWGEEGQAEIGILAFGSTEGAIREATARAKADGYSIAHMQLRLINPLPVSDIEAFAKRCKKILVPELNYSGQFAGWLKVNTDIKFKSFHKDEGVPFTPNELYVQITSLAD
jgi:2-oxoglutarate ferredoxin oxidoreductase subunit alpha